MHSSVLHDLSHPGAERASPSLVLSRACYKTAIVVPLPVLERWCDRHEEKNPTKPAIRLHGTHATSTGQQTVLGDHSVEQKPSLACWTTKKSFHAYKITCMARIASLGGCSCSFTSQQQARSSRDRSPGIQQPHSLPPAYTSGAFECCSKLNHLTVKCIMPQPTPPS